MNIIASTRDWLRIGAFAVLILAGLIVGELLLILVGNVVVDGSGVISTLSGFTGALGAASIALAAAAGVYLHQARGESSQQGGIKGGR